VTLTIDVIIPTYNRPESAANVAASILPQLGPGDALYVVWQGSQKPVLPEAPALHLVHSAPPGLPRARNAGVRAGRGDIVLFLDDDVEVGPALLVNHRAVYADADVGAVAGRLDDPLFTPADESIASYDETTGALKQNFCQDRSGYTISLMGANMSFSRTAIESIGLFDENFLHNALREEVDAAFRLQRTGRKIRYCPAARARHLREASGGCRDDKRATYLFHEFANYAYFAARHAPRKYWQSWFTYWKYRLEYETRKKVAWMRHDPWLVAAGAFGACMGIVRYVLWGKKKEGKREDPLAKSAKDAKKR
jgi:GT2 family glycosyltransferase